MGFRFVKISEYYEEYLSFFYRKNKHVPEEYNQHLDYLLKDGFNYGNSFRRNLFDKGIQAYEIICNDKILQEKWVVQNSDTPIKNYSTDEILVKQLLKIKPDVIYWNRVVDISLIKKLKQELPSIKVIFTYQGVGIKNYDDYQVFDFVLSCLKSEVLKLKKEGVDAYFVRHGFNSQILNIIEDRDEYIDFSFIGSVINKEGYHTARAEYILELLNETPLELWTSLGNLTTREKIKYYIKEYYKDYKWLFDRIGIEHKLESRINSWSFGNSFIFPSKLHYKINSPVYGIEMFQTIADSLVGFNIHIDVAEKYAANIRMYETTGVGTCLLTDWKEDISEYFEPDYEVVTYKSKAEAKEKIRYLLNNTEEIQRISKRGQKRTLKDHTLLQRINEIEKIIRRYI